MSGVSHDVSPIRQFGRNSTWLTTGNVVAGVFLFIQAVAMTRSIGLSGYGDLMLVVVYVTAVGQLLDFRAWEPIVKFVPEYTARGKPHMAGLALRYLGGLELAAALVAYILVVVTADWAASFLGVTNEDGARLIRWMALSILVKAPVEPIYGLLRALNATSWQVAHLVGSAAIRTALVVSVALTGPTLALFVFSFLASSAVAGASSLIAGSAILRRSSIPFWTASSADLDEERRSILGFAGLASLTGVSRVLSSRIDTLIVGALTNPAVVGAYELAKQVTNYSQFVVSPIYSAVYPEISQLVANREFARLRSFIQRICVWLALPAVGIPLIGTAIAPWAIPMVFGMSFEPSVGLFQILIWQTLWLSLVWLPGLLLATGRPKVLTALTWLDALIFLSLLLIGTTIYGAYGAAVACVVRIIVWMSMATLCAHRTMSTFRSTDLAMESGQRV